MPDQENKGLSPELQEKFKYFVENSDTDRISRNITRIFFDYLRYQTTGESVDFDDILNDVEKIIDLMNAITDSREKDS